MQNPNQPKQLGINLKENFLKRSGLKNIDLKRKIIKFDTQKK